MKIQVIGQGVKKLSQMTLEGLEALRGAKKILHIATDPEATSQWLTSQGLHHHQCMKDLYETSAIDLGIYKDLLAKIRSELIIHKNIAVLVPGHPRLGVTLVQWLEKAKDKWNAELIVYPGISSFATMINDLAVDPIERGSQIFDANRMLLYKHPINPFLDTYIYHVCSIGTARAHVDDPSCENQILWLKKHLLQYFSEDHEVKLISSSIRDGQCGAEIRLEALGNLEGLLETIHFGTTLFIPAARPNVFDRDYFALMKESYATPMGVQNVE